MEGALVPFPPQVPDAIDKRTRTPQPVSHPSTPRCPRQATRVRSSASSCLSPSCWPFCGLWSSSPWPCSSLCLSKDWRPHWCACVLMLTVRSALMLAFRQSLAVPGFRYVTRALRAILVRLQLLVLGFAWIPVEVQASKRGCADLFPSYRRSHLTFLDSRASVGGAGAISSSVQPPVPGDLIVCNWSSPIDVLYLSFRQVCASSP